MVKAYNEFQEKYLPIQAEAEKVSIMTPTEFNIWCVKNKQAHVEEILYQLRYMALTYRQKSTHIMKLIGG